MTQPNKSNSRGVLMFAHNNEEIDYFKLAVVNAMLIQHHLKLSAEQITVVTDSNSLKYAEETLGDKVHKAIGNIIINEKDPQFKHSNQRVYKDTSHRSVTLPFYNKNRGDAYELSPYDETIVIDADYLILSDALNQCWGHNNDIMMNHEYCDVMHGRTFTGFECLNPLGITMYWATVVYFKKTSYAKTLFEIVKHVREKRTYYGNLYQWTGGLYRNDFSFSIAAHMIGGFKDKSIPQLPVKLYKTFDNDDVYTVDDNLSFIMCLEKHHCPGDFIMTRWTGVDIHIMNKWALNRISDNVLEVLHEKEIA